MPLRVVLLVEASVGTSEALSSMLVPSRLSAALAALTLVATTHGESFTIINGQIFTPGLAIVDAPQPNTPQGGGKFSISFLISFPASRALYRVPFYAVHIIPLN